MVDQPRWALDSDRLTGRPNRTPIGATRSPDGPSVLTRAFFALLLISLATVQATFVPALGVFGVFPDFVLVFLLIWSAARGVGEGLIWAFGLGIWLDLLTMDPLGTHAIALLVVAVIGGSVR